MEKYCSRIKEEVRIFDNSISCKYFILNDGKPVCKKVINLPLPTTGSVMKSIFQQLVEPTIIFTGINLGKPIYPSWWCLLFRIK
jgi:hypothetical protein